MKLVYIVIDLTVTVHVDDLSFCEYLHGLYCGWGRVWSEEGKEENGSEYEDNGAEEWKRCMVEVKAVVVVVVLVVR